MKTSPPYETYLCTTHYEIFITVNICYKKILHARVYIAQSFLLTGASSYHLADLEVPDCGSGLSQNHAQSSIRVVFSDWQRDQPSSVETNHPTKKPLNIFGYFLKKSFLPRFSLLWDDSTMYLGDI